MPDEKYSVVFDMISKGGKPLILNAPPSVAGGGRGGAFAGGSSQSAKKSEANAWATIIGAAVIGGMMKGFARTKSLAAVKVTGKPMQLWARGSFGKDAGQVKALQQPFATNKPLSYGKAEVPKSKDFVGTNDKAFEYDPKQSMLLKERNQQKKIREALERRLDKVEQAREGTVGVSPSLVKRAIPGAKQVQGKELAAEIRAEASKKHFGLPEQTLAEMKKRKEIQKAFRERRMEEALKVIDNFLKGKKSISAGEIKKIAEVQLSVGSLFAKNARKAGKTGSEPSVGKSRKKVVEEQTDKNYKKLKSGSIEMELQGQ